VNCFDCANDTGPVAARPAVGICVLCGAGVCGEHATVTTHHLTRVEVVNRNVAVEPPARRIYCHTCAAAVDAQAHPPDHAIHFPHRHH
jgi:hypothetical protein